MNNDTFSRLLRGNFVANNFSKISVIFQKDVNYFEPSPTLLLQFGPTWHNLGKLQLTRAAQDYRGVVVASPQRGKCTNLVHQQGMGSADNSAIRYLSSAC